MLHDLSIIFTASLLFLLPGLALLLWLLPDQDVDWFGWLSLSAGLSLATFPLLLLWTRALGGIRMGPLPLWVILVVCTLLIAWQLRRRPNLQRAVRNTPLWFSLLLILSAGVVLGVRLWAIRGLTVPLWGDSVQHTVIAQLLVDRGGLFNSWLPYAPYQSLTVHFGFHAAVAAFQWATGMEAAQATLLVGQIVNALAVFTLYPLTMRVAGGNRWAGVGTLWVIGLLSPMPAFYVNWGRYPQLAGQAILPVALWLVTTALDSRQGSRLASPWGWRASVLSGVAAAGMSLSYYRMPYYWGVFVLAWLVSYILPRLRWDGKKWLIVAARLFVVGGIAAVLLLPWVRHIAGGELVSKVVSTAAAGPPPLRRVMLEYLGWLHITTYLPWWLLTIAGIAVIWSIARRQWSVTSVGLWIVGLALLPAGRLVHLPGAAHMQVFAIIIALYIPVGILIGWLLGEGISWLLRLRHTLGYATVPLILVFVLGWGVRQQINIVESDYIMVTQSDLAAMDWIRANTSEEARFLVNGFLIYNGRSAVGADAGWWIPLLANRQNTMPPQYALTNEIPIDPSYSQDIVNLVAQLQEVSLSSPEGISQLCQQDISHVYVGQGQGHVGLGAVPLYLPDELVGSPAFASLYHQDQVWVFAFDRSACPVGVKDPG
jgi:hypothetical protein